MANAHYEPVFGQNEEKAITAHLLATPQLLHGRFAPTYERILNALVAADPTKLTPGELEALGEKGKVFFGEGFVPPPPRRTSKSRKTKERRKAKQAAAAASGRNVDPSKPEEGITKGDEGIEVIDYQQIGSGQMGNGSQHSGARKLDRDLSIFVRGINDSMTAEGLKDAFVQFGTVNAVDVVYDKNCAYIEFTSKEDCERAIKAQEIAIGDATVFAYARRIWHGPRGGYGRGGRSGRGGGYRNYNGGEGGGGDSGRRSDYGPRQGYRGGRGYRGNYRGRGRDEADEDQRNGGESEPPLNQQEDDQAESKE